ncbi:MAG: hypothetical protein AB7G21_00150 [Dehalococcoidia bacterium]
MLKWMWRGLLTRIGIMTQQIPPPPHRRDPEVSKHFQVEPVEEQDLPPTEAAGDDPKQQPQAHPHPAERRGSMQNG